MFLMLINSILYLISVFLTDKENTVLRKNNEHID